MPARTKNTATTADTTKPARTCLRLHVELLSGKGFLFRVNRPGCHIDILPTQTLEDLHETIHRAFNRSEKHLYYFTTSDELPHEAGEHYTVPDDPGTPEYDRNARDSRTTTLGQMQLREGQCLHYLYDFVHDWWHKITVVSLQEQAPAKIVYPRISGYTGSAAPEETMPLYRGAANGDTIAYALMPPHLQDVARTIYGLIRTFCDEKLTPDYEKFCGRLLYACALAELRLDRGKPESWAAGIVYAIGSNNGLFYTDASPRMRATEIGPAFGVSAATAQNKGRQLCKDFDIQSFDSHYTSLGESYGYDGANAALLGADPAFLASAIDSELRTGIRPDPQDIAMLGELIKAARGESDLFSQAEAMERLEEDFPKVPLELLDMIYTSLVASLQGQSAPATPGVTADATPDVIPGLIPADDQVSDDDDEDDEDDEDEWDPDWDSDDEMVDEWDDEDDDDDEDDWDDWDDEEDWDDDDDWDEDDAAQAPARGKPGRGK